jgi:XRE family transcriptional regulator, regulator of sulfur utilization
MTIGQVTRDLRKDAHIQQGVVAKKLGISQTYLSLVERGVRNPSRMMVKKLADFYKLPAPVMEWLTMTEDQVVEDKREAFKKIKPAMDALVQEFFRLSK